MKFKNNAFNELENRGFVFQATNLEETKRILSEAPITFYIGIDPTADDLHIGHFLDFKWQGFCKIVGIDVLCLLVERLLLLEIQVIKLT